MQRTLPLYTDLPAPAKPPLWWSAIVQTLKEESQVLVCAPSNTAVDLLVEKLIEKGISTVRTGHPARVTDEILSQTLDAKIVRHASYKELKMVRRKADEYREMGLKYKRNFGQAEREQRRLLLSEARSLKEEAGHLEFYITNDILSSSTGNCLYLGGRCRICAQGPHLYYCFYR